jgi:hypothetical protein
LTGSTKPLAFTLVAVPSDLEKEIIGFSVGVVKPKIRFGSKSPERRKF